MTKPEPKNLELSHSRFEYFLDMYTDLCYDKMMEDDGMNFFRNENDLSNEDWLNLDFDCMEWEANYDEFTVDVGDSHKDEIVQLTKAFSVYMDYTVEHGKVYDLPFFVCQIFLSECYTRSIRKWLWEHSQHFSGNKLLSEGLEVLDNFNKTCETFFCNFDC